MPDAILNVSGHEARREARTELLEGAGFTVIEASSGAGALRLAVETRPSLVLLDVGLPDLDGLEVCRRLRSQPETAHVPVIHVSAPGRAGDDYTESIEHGADACLREPLDAELLVATIKALIRARSAEAERDRSLQAAREAERRAALVLETISEAYAVLDAGFRFTYLNREAERIVGVGRDALLGRVPWEALPALAGTPLESHLRKAVESRAPYDFEYRSPASGRWFHARSWPSPDGGIAGYFTEITARKQAGEQLLFQAQLLAAVGQSVIAASPEGTIRYWGPAAEVIFGWKAEEAIGRDIMDLVVPDIPSEEGDRIVARLKCGESWTGAFRARRKNGEVFWCETTASPIADASGNPIGIVSISSDTTGRHSAEEALLRSEARFRSLVEANPAGIVHGDMQGNIRMANDALLRMVGYTREDLARGLRWTDLTPPEWRHLDRERGAEAREQGVCTPYEKEYIRKDGTRIPVVVGYALLGEEREESVAFILDVTALKRAEQARKEIEERYRLVTRATNDAIWDWDIVTDRVRWSGATDVVLGCPPEAGGSDSAWWRARLHPDDAGGIERVLREALERGEERFSGEYRFRRADDVWIRVLDRAFVIRDAQGKPVRMVGSMLDVTRVRQAEEELRDLNLALERSNEDLQHFAYAVSHDLQEPLRAIGSFTGLLAKSLSGNLKADEQEYLGYILGGAERMRQLIHALLEYSRVSHDTRAMVPTDAGAALRFALMNLEPAIQEAGAVVTFDPLPRVLANELLVQVFQNVIGNAVKYRANRKPEIDISAFIGEDGYCQFSITDNGIGFEMAQAERVFQVFRRLHPRDEYPGTGVGLAITKRIIERFGGRIWAESAPGHGSTFRFTLPHAE